MTYPYTNLNTEQINLLDQDLTDVLEPRSDSKSGLVSQIFDKLFAAQAVFTETDPVFTAWLGAGGATGTFQNTVDASLGAEIITTTNDRTFAGAGNWTGTNWTIGSGHYNHTAGANDATLAGYAAVVGETYLIQMTIYTSTVGSVTAYYGGASNFTIGGEVGSIGYKMVVTATNTDGLSVSPNPVWVGYIDNVSIKKITSSNGSLFLKNAIGVTGVEGRVIDEYGFGLGLNALKQSVESYNVALGNEALATNVEGFANIALGHGALQNHVDGDGNVAIGYHASLQDIIGVANVAVGRSALEENPLALYSVAIGVNALSESWSGSYNTAIGYGALQSLNYYDNCTGLGANATVLGNNEVQLGDSATTTYSWGAVIPRVSDARDKADIRDTVLGLEFINKLRPVDYKWDYREDYRKDEKDIGEVKTDGSKKRTRYHHGLIAQEVEQVIKETGIDFGGFKDRKIKGGQDALTIDYSELITPLIKAVQELTARVAILEGR